MPATPRNNNPPDPKPGKIDLSESDRSQRHGKAQAILGLLPGEKAKTIQ
jgi:hypothetical protein